MDANGQRISIENSRITLKILHPPGGASSNIFGIDEDKDNQQRKPVKNHMQSDIFGPTGPALAPSPFTIRRPIDDSQTRLFGEPKVLAQQQPETKDDDSEMTDKKAINDRRKGFNPITGQSYDENSPNGDRMVRNDDTSKPLAATSSTQTRARQPPGGTASKLW